MCFTRFLRRTAAFASRRYGVVEISIEVRRRRRRRATIWLFRCLNLWPWSRTSWRMRNRTTRLVVIDLYAHNLYRSADRRTLYYRGTTRSTTAESCLLTPVLTVAIALVPGRATAKMTVSIGALSTCRPNEACARLIGRSILFLLPVSCFFCSYFFAVSSTYYMTSDCTRRARVLRIMYGDEWETISQWACTHLKRGTLDVRR